MAAAGARTGVVSNNLLRDAEIIEERTVCSERSTTTATSAPLGKIARSGRDGALSPLRWRARAPNPIK